MSQATNENALAKKYEPVLEDSCDQVRLENVPICVPQ